MLLYILPIYPLNLLAGYIFPSIVAIWIGRFSDFSIGIFAPTFREEKGDSVAVWVGWLLLEFLRDGMLKFQLGWPLIAHFVGLSNPGKQWMRNLPKVCADGVWNFQLGWPSNPVMGIGMYQAMVMIGIKLATCKLKLVGHQLSFLKSTDLYTVEKHGGG